MNRSPNVLLIF